MRVVGSLLGTRIVYAINWFVIAAIFSSMARDLNQDVAGLGVLTASFYLGISAFQLPAAILSGKISPRRVVVYGMALFSFSDLMIGFTNQFYLIAVLRFVVGMGMAMVFAPSVILIVRHFKPGRAGLGVGLLNGFFDIGAAAGLFGWAVLSVAFGWRLSMDLSGGLGLASALALWLILPRGEVQGGFILSAANLRRVLADRQLLILNVCLFGLASSTLIGGFVVYYLHEEFGVPVGLSGLVGGLNMLIALMASPVIGRLYDRVGSFRKIFAISSAASAVGLGLAAFSAWGALLASLMAGFGLGGGLTIGFIVARESERDPAYQTIAVAWVNAAGLAGAFVAPIIFTWLVVGFGYFVAWVLAGAYGAASILPVLWLKDGESRGAETETLTTR
jgi:predicted MFS family arabinose efflux permease